MSLVESAREPTDTQDNAAQTRAGRRAFSPEIHGLRGLALTMVVAFHLFGRGRVSGGVDVFLIVSAYLITGSLQRALKTGSFSLANRYSRTLSRLLPAALVTIASTTLFGAFVMPRSMWEDLFRQAAASATFSENIYLATTGMQYGAAGAETSPFQHFWSLSLQGQFLILWPLAAYLLLLLLHRASGGTRSAVFTGLAAVMTVASFIYAQRLVAIDQTVAYYSLVARLWEFGLGALAVTVVVHTKKNPRTWGVLGWAGVVMILSSGFVIDGARLFPGPWALWPAVGTILVLFAADSGGARGVGLTRALSFRPVRWLAGLGYTLYLWHWPVLILYLAYRGREAVGWRGALVILLVSVVLAEFSNRLITAPVGTWADRQRTSRWGSLKVLGAVLSAVVLVAGTAWGLAAREAERKGAALDRGDADRGASVSLGETLEPDPLYPGAAALVDPDLYPGPWESVPRPQPDVAPVDGSGLEGTECVTDAKSSELTWCVEVEGTPGGKRVVLAGGSHDTQWNDALVRVAQTQGWELIVMGKDGCRLSRPDPDHPLTDLCWEWNPIAIEQIIDLHPDAVFTLGTVTNPINPEVVYQGQVQLWEDLNAVGIPVIALRDNPRFDWKIPACLETAESESDCGVDRDAVYGAAPPSEVLSHEGVWFIDSADWFCDPKRCEPVVGNVVVYRDHGHFTATYADSMAPFLLQALKEEAPFLFMES